MDNQDIFNKIKSVAENAETKDFPSMEKVWSRIDAKLDTKVEKKHNNNWKKLVVAASVVALISFSYFLFKPEEMTIPQVVIKDSLETKILDTTHQQNAIVSTKDEESDIKENAEELLKQQNSKTIQDIALEEFKNKKEYSVDESKNDDELEKYKESSPITLSEKDVIKLTTTSKTNGWMVESKSAARGVTYYNQAMESDAKSEEIITVKKQEPLVVIDNEVRKGGYSSLDSNEIESLVELPNPIYYINGIEYSEEELFGKNPTSPYAPLNKQKIETISILQPDKAVSLYGKKGEKGVVIITTKDGKPRAK